MEAKVHKDLTTRLRDDRQGALGLGLHKMLAKYANKAQATGLTRDFPDLFVIKDGKAKVKRVRQSAPTPSAPPPPATKNPTTKPNVKPLRVILGGYGHKAGAEEDARQFLHPQVLQYRSAIFPNPRAHGVKVDITQADAVELTGANPLFPWGVQLRIDIHGAPDKVESWSAAFKGRIRTQQA